MKTSNALIAATTGIFTLIMCGAAFPADATKGSKVFRKCKSCHVVGKEKNKVGPHLVGIIGRPAASIEGFKYSKAMKEAGLTWDVETLAKYLKKPKKLIPGTKMVFVGLKKDAQIEDLIAFLREASKKSE